MKMHDCVIELRTGLRTIVSAGVLAVLLLACAGTAAGATTWVVDDSGGAGVDYTTIQAAVDAASEGGTIEVRSGVYVENVDVDKQLTLRGIDTGEGMPVVDAGENGSAITLSAGWSRIESFIAINSSYGWDIAGIRVISDNNSIKNNRASNNTCGIYLSSSGSNTLNSNDAHDNDYGIRLHSSGNNNLSSNHASNNTHGIYLSSSSYNTLANNTVSNNSDDGIHLHRSSQHNMLANNIVSNNSDDGVHLYSCYNTLANNTVSNNSDDGIYLYSSYHNTLTNNTVSNNGDGIVLWSLSSHNTLISNTVSNNDYDAIVLLSSNNTLSSNTLLNNRYGVFLSGNYNTITRNMVSNNNYGIHLHSSSNNNTIHHNNLIDNCDQNAYDTGTNQWDSGSEGNHYSDYTGTDSDGDDIGDTPYPIPGGGSVDGYPLMEPWSDAMIPIASFTHTTTGLTASFTSTSHDPGGHITNHNWNFGDSETSSAENPAHTYPISGDYPVKLTVTDNDGYKNSKTVTISVGDGAITRVNHPSDIPSGTELTIEVNTDLETDITLDLDSFHQTLHGRDVIFNIDTATLAKGEHTLTVAAGSDTYTDSIIIYDPAIYQTITKGLDDLETCSRDEMYEISGKTGYTLTNHVYTILSGVEVGEDVTAGDVLNELRGKLGEISDKVTTELETFKNILITLDGTLGDQVGDLDSAVNSITNIQNAISEVSEQVSDENIVESVNEYVTKPAVYTAVCADEANSINARTQTTKSNLDPYYTRNQLDDMNDILSIGKEAIANTDGEQIYRLHIGTFWGHEISAKPTLGYFADRQTESLNPPPDKCIDIPLIGEKCISGKYDPTWVYHLTLADAESMLTIPAYIDWIDATPEDEIMPAPAPMAAPLVIVIKAIKAYMAYVDSIEKISPYMIDGGMIISTDLLAKEVDEEHADVVEAISYTLQPQGAGGVDTPTLTENGLHVPEGNILVTTSPDGKIRNFKYVKSDLTLPAPENQRVISLNTGWSQSFGSEPQNISVTIAANKSSYNLSETVNLTINISSDTYIEDAMLWIFAPESNTTIKDILNVTTGNMSRNYNFTIRNETWHVPRVYLTNFGAILAENYTSFGVGSESRETGIITTDYDEFYDPGTVSLNVTIHNPGNTTLNSTLEYSGSHPGLAGSIEMPLLQAGEQTTEQLTFYLTMPDVYEMSFILNASNRSNGTLDYNTAWFTVTARDTLLAFPSTDKPIYNTSEGVNIAVTVKNVTLDIVDFPYSLNTTMPSGNTTIGASFIPDHNGTYIVKATPIAEGYCVVEGETLFIVEKQSSLMVETKTVGNTTTITVKTDFGGVVEGADVVVNGYTSKTDDDGVVEFGSFNTTQLIIQAEKFGFNPIVASVNLTTVITPNITSFAPPSPVNDTVGATRTFNITIDQTANVSWQINGSEVFNETDVDNSTYSNTSAALGVWNVSVVVSNANGVSMQTWAWNVQDTTPPTVEIISPKEGWVNASMCVRLNFTAEGPSGIDWIGYSLDGGDNVTIAGNTTIGGLGAGSHNVTVYVNDTAGNENSSDTVSFTLHPGDISGDSHVYLSDLMELADAFNSHPGDPNWNPRADMDCDGYMYLPDLMILADNFDEHY